MATGCQFRTDLRANFVGEICHAGEIRSIFPVGILRNFDRQISFHFGFHPPETENLKEKMPKTNILEEVFSWKHHLINYVGGFHAPQLKVWNSNLASVEQRSHNSSYGISLLDFTVQWCCFVCWPGPKRSIVLTEIYSKFAKQFIQIAGPKNIQHNVLWSHINY